MGAVPPIRRPRLRLRRLPPPQPTTVTVAPSTATLSAIGATVQLSADVRDQNGQPMPGVAVSWGSADPAVAAVGASGLVTAVAPGSATLTATAGAATGSATVTVDQAVSAVSVTAAASAIMEGDTLRFAAHATDANGHAVADAEFVWASADPGVATVDATGLVTGVAAGTTEITATSSGVTGRVPVSVEAATPVPRSVTVTPSAATLAPGDTVRLEAEAFDADGQPVHGLTFTWSSDDPSVARTDQSGLVTAVAGGTTEITAATDSAQGTAAITVASNMDRAALRALYDATGGPSWNVSDNWLTDAPLDEWHGIGTDHTGRVTSIHLPSNGLSGTLPPALGDLASLAELILDDNDLDGAIPAELGRLNNLRALAICCNRLSGAIPADLGGLGRLELLYLNSNVLSGPIPARLGELDRLVALSLRDNELTDPIPAELGNLTSLAALWLDRNALSGPIPAEIGNLVNLELLWLGHNRLSGSLPTGIGNLVALVELGVEHNEGLAGALPDGMANLTRLSALRARGTSLCVPPALFGWLETVETSPIPRCVDPGADFGYLVQAVQSPGFPVTLVTGEEALLRVFLTAGRTTSETLPDVRARFFAGGEIHTVDIPGTTTPIPTEIDEGDLSKSLNVTIPGDVVRPGLEMVIEVAPGRTLDPGLGVPARIPAEGRAALDVRSVPPLDVTAIPFVWTQTQDSAVVRDVADIVANPGGHELLEATRTLLPVAGLDVVGHAPVLSSSNSAFDLLQQLEAIRAMEGGQGHYLAMMRPPVADGVLGLAHTPGRIAFAVPGSAIIAHELGHNLSLDHAPCGGPADPDPDYPHPNGATGSWGYDFTGGGVLVEPWQGDLMGYCFPPWISSYHFNKALRYRLGDEETSEASPATATSLLLWGGVDPAGPPRLEPAFVVDAPPLLPEEGGDWTLEGRDSVGRVLFSVPFGMEAVPDAGPGAGTFAFALPVRSGWEGLASVTLSGPGGTAVLDGATDDPVTFLRGADAQVRAVLRGPPALAFDASPPGGMEAVFSRGLPSAGVWRR